MRILTLNYEFPPLGGGAAPVSEELAMTLVEQGYEVDVITMRYDGLPSRETRHGFAIHRVPSLRRSETICRPHEMISFLPAGFSKARSLTAKHGYDIVHSHFITPTGAIAYALYKSHGLPYFVTAHGSDVPGYNPDRFRSLHKLIRPLWRTIAANAETIVSPSAYLARLIRASIEESNTEVIPNGFDHERFVPARGKEKRILVTSRLFERKGIQNFLDALRLIDTDWEVVITGEGPYRDTLKRIADRNAVDVTFVGWVERDTLKDFLETSEIYVFPSSHENCPVALQEAMAAGNAVLASKYSGTAEVVGDAGITVDPEDTRTFARELERLLVDSELRNRLQEQARERITQEFCWDRIGSEYMDIMSGICPD